MQMHGGIVELVTQDGPQETRLGAFGVAQQLQTLRSGLLEHAAHHFVGLGAAGYIVALAIGGCWVETQDVSPHLLVETGTGFLSQVAPGHQFGEHGRRGEIGVERVSLQAQVVLQSLDHMRHGVQAHHIGGAEGAGAGAAEFLAGQVVHHVVGKAEILGLLHRGQHAGDTDAVGNEVGCVVGTHHAFAQAAGYKGFQVVQHMRVGRGGIDQLHQQHVTRGVEEMDAAETWFDGFRQGLAQLCDREPRGIGRDDRVRRQVRCNFAVQVELPVHTFGNRFDHQVTFLQQAHVLFIVRLAYQVRVLHQAQWRGFEFFKAFNSLAHNCVLRAFPGRQIEQQHRHPDIDQVRGNLRAHHARAQHGDLFDLETVH